MLHEYAVGCLLHIAACCTSTLLVVCCTLLQELVGWYVRHNIEYEEAKVEAALDKFKNKEEMMWRQTS